MAGRTAGRGYGSPHQQERRRWTHAVTTGQVICWRCQTPIAPDEPWDLGHDDNDRTQYRGPEHMRCNRQAAGRKHARRRPQPPHPGSII